MEDVVDFRDAELPRLRRPSDTAAAPALDSDSAYFTPTDHHRHLGLYCLGVGWQHGAAAPMRGRVLSSYAAVLVSHGRGHLHTPRSGRQTVQGPMLFWLFPGVAHTYAPDARGWTERWLLFDGLSARSYTDLGYLRVDAPITALSPDSEQHRLFEAVIDRCAEPGPRSEVELAVLTHRLVVSGGAAAPDGRAHTHADRLVAALRRDACLPVDMAAHARRLGVTLPGLRAAVRDRTGATPKEVVLQARVSQAKALLGQTDMLVAQVAHEVGYDDPAYFSRLFSRLTGASPATFRDQQRRSVP